MPSMNDCLADLAVLLLEDNALIAMDVEEMLLSLGAASVRVAHSVEEAIAAVRSTRIDAAVLDLVIGSGTSETVARSLIARDVPLVFASGFDSRSMLASELADIPRIEKPYSAEAISDAMSRSIASRGEKSWRIA